MRGWQSFCRIEKLRGARGPIEWDKQVENFPQLAAMNSEMRCGYRAKAGN